MKHIKKEWHRGNRAREGGGRRGCRGGLTRRRRRWTCGTEATRVKRHAVEKRGLCQIDSKMAERTRQNRDTGGREATNDKAAGEERRSIIGTAAAVWGSEMRRLRRPMFGQAVTGESRGWGAGP